jgi:superfamily II DNA or RNA helicase
MYTSTSVELYEPVSIDVNMMPGWELRDYQVDVVDFIVNATPGDHRSRLVALPTGKGKTLCALYAISKIKTRTLLFILPTYIDRWADEIPKVLSITKKDILVIRGSGQLKSMLYSALDEELYAKFIVISIPTMKNYIKAYEQNPYNLDDEGYGCNPEQMCRVLGIGTVIIDETHQHLHGVYKILSYTHVPKVVALSATMVSDDPVIKKIQRTMFPSEIRYDSVSMDLYIKVYAVAYQFLDIHKSRIRTTEFGSNNYSHHAFEKSVIKNQDTLSNYLEMINKVVTVGYIEEYVTEDEMLIFASSLNMCRIICDHLRLRHPHLDINTFVESDPYTNLMDSDICVTTIGSAGTAHDIPNLRTVLLTTNIDSIQSNIQVLGRLRDLKTRDTKFYYLYCEQITKQVRYHNKKVELFRDRAACIKHVKYPKGV